MTKYQPANVVGLNNDTMELVQDFIEGCPFKVELSEQLLRTFDMVNKDRDYMSTVKKVTVFLNNNVPGYVGNVCIIDSKGVEFDAATRAVLVRFINIVHRGRYNIVLNEEVIYVAYGYRRQNKEEYGRYIRLAILDYKDQTKSKVMRQLKGDVRLFVSDMKKTVLA